MSAAAVASSVLNTDSEYENMSTFIPNFIGNKDLETVLVFSLEDDNGIGIIGLLTEQQVEIFNHFEILIALLQQFIY